MRLPSSHYKNHSHCENHSKQTSVINSSTNADQLQDSSAGHLGSRANTDDEYDEGKPPIQNSCKRTAVQKPAASYSRPGVKRPYRSTSSNPGMLSIVGQSCRPTIAASVRTGKCEYRGNRPCTRATKNMGLLASTEDDFSEDQPEQTCSASDSEYIDDGGNEYRQSDDYDEPSEDDVDKNNLGNYEVRHPRSKRLKRSPSFRKLLFVSCRNSH